MKNSFRQFPVPVEVKRLSTSPASSNSIPAPVNAK